MSHLFDFGISQEDPLTEFSLLDIREGDHVLCIASGGEIPLSLYCLQPGITITAVDTSLPQILLCKFKWQAAKLLPFPLSGAFLGYSHQDRKTRREIYFDQLRPSLSAEECGFWDAHIDAVEKGVVNSGRFEKYIANLRTIARLIIGKRNIEKLLRCRSTEEQAEIFDHYIATRPAVRYLFKIAFHPAVYKNRGLSSRGLIHAQQKTGEIFFNKFRNFCVCTPATSNYFLHYFLEGSCTTEQAMPEFLVHHKNLVQTNSPIFWRCTSIQEELKQNEKGAFNKIHLSNIGDWMTEADFSDLVDLMSSKSGPEQKILYRYLRKNHFAEHKDHEKGYSVREIHTETTDRFPFYSMQLLEHYE
jgi:S-adenosylmethionine:diacylglycerol 3-amino-3-carboxypropyl transferase